MAYEATVTYTKPIIRSGIGHFWRRYIAWHGFAAIAICAFATVVLFAIGDRSWITGVLLTLTVLLSLMSTAVYVVFLRRSLWKFNLMDSKSVTFIFGEDSISTSSDLGKSELSWKAIEQVWKFSDVWLLFAARTVFITLPIADIDKTVQDYVAERVRCHGGRIR